MPRNFSADFKERYAITEQRDKATTEILQSEGVAKELNRALLCLVLLERGKWPDIVERFCKNWELRHRLGMDPVPDTPEVRDGAMSHIWVEFSKILDDGFPPGPLQEFKDTYERSIKRSITDFDELLAELAHLPQTSVVGGRAPATLSFSGNPEVESDVESDQPMDDEPPHEERDSFGKTWRHSQPYLDACVTKGARKQLDVIDEDPQRLRVADVCCAECKKRKRERCWVWVGKKKSKPCLLCRAMKINCSRPSVSVRTAIAHRRIEPTPATSAVVSEPPFPNSTASTSHAPLDSSSGPSSSRSTENPSTPRRKGVVKGGFTGAVGTGQHPRSQPSLAPPLTQEETTTEISYDDLYRLPHLTPEEHNLTYGYISEYGHHSAMISFHWAEAIRIQKKLAALHPSVDIVFPNPMDSATGALDVDEEVVPEAASAEQKRKTAKGKEPLHVRFDTSKRPRTSDEGLISTKRIRKKKERI